MRVNYCDLCGKRIEGPACGLSVTDGDSHNDIDVVQACAGCIHDLRSKIKELIAARTAKKVDPPESLRARRGEPLEEASRP